MRRIILSTAAVFVFSIMACTNSGKSNPQLEVADSTLTQNTNDMNSFVSIFEIPTTEISRAVEFYQTILDIKIEAYEMPGMKMGVFPSEGQTTIGVLMQGEDYMPSANGVTIYLNGGDNLQSILDKIEPSGGKIIVPKTPHADESGYFALFLDTEGNKLGLHSPN